MAKHKIGELNGKPIVVTREDIDGHEVTNNEIRAEIVSSKIKLSQRDNNGTLAVISAGDSNDGGSDSYDVIDLNINTMYLDRRILGSTKYNFIYAISDNPVFEDSVLFIENEISRIYDSFREDNGVVSMMLKVSTTENFSLPLLQFSFVDIMPVNEYPGFSTTISLIAITSTKNLEFAKYLLEITGEDLIDNSFELQADEYSENRLELSFTPIMIDINTVKSRRKNKVKTSNSSNDNNFANVFIKIREIINKIK